MKTSWNEKELITVKQAARILDLSEQYIRQLFDDESLKGIRIQGGPRLIDRNSVEQFRKKRQALTA